MNGREKHKKSRKWNLNSVFVALRVLSRLLPSASFLCLGIPFADTARSIELLATEVLPVIRRESAGQAEDVA